ncbi:MAG TPA: hypothetical protein VK613_03515 [Gaiellaceae bacterium]|nr:hypothetical protein [Gaiellaceae bacterium]
MTATRRTASDDRRCDPVVDVVGELGMLTVNEVEEHFPVAAVDSGLPGPKGNREVFLHLVHREHPELPDDIDDRIAAAVV